MRDLEELFDALSKSSFRTSKKLGAKDADYLGEKGLARVLEHAAGFIEARLAPAHPLNDGKQTPWRGHPVFVAQHATATCCRSCLGKWHQIPKGRELNEEEIIYVVEVIRRWLEMSDELS
jgi:hypothetical protein